MRILNLDPRQQAEIVPVRLAKLSCQIEQLEHHCSAALLGSGFGIEFAVSDKFAATIKRREAPQIGAGAARTGIPKDIVSVQPRIRSRQAPLALHGQGNQQQ